MRSAKKAALEMIKDLPEDTSMEDIQYHLYVREKVERGLSEVREGRTIETPEVAKRMKRWLTK